MKAIMLAAGLGTRLRPITDTTPKCLLPIAGQPLLTIWLEHLARHGISQLLINTHWLAEQVVAFVQQQSDHPVRIELFHEPELLGSAGTLLANREWLGRGPFFILYGDNLTDVDLSALARFHASHDACLTLGLFRAANPSQCGIAEIDAEDLVTGFIEKPAAPVSNLAAAGLYMADHRLFDYFQQAQPETGPFDFSRHILPRLVNHMKGYEIDGFLMDIGSSDSYRLAEQLWLQRTHPTASV